MCRCLGKRATVTLLLKDPSPSVEEVNSRGITVSPNISKLEPVAFYSKASGVYERAMRGPFLVEGMKGISLHKVVRRHFWASCKATRALFGAYGPACRMKTRARGRIVRHERRLGCSSRVALFQRALVNAVCPKGMLPDLITTLCPNVYGPLQAAKTLLGLSATG